MSVVKTQDVCGDGGLLKRVLKASAESHRTPRLGARVKIRYEGSLASCGTRFDSGRAEFHTGEAQVITAWDKGVATMRKGELAVFVCRADYAFGESGKPPQVPPDAAVKYEIELLSYQEPTRELWEMSPADKLEEALRLKAAGAEAFKASDWAAALGKYREAATKGEHVAQYLSSEDDTVDLLDAMSQLPEVPPPVNKGMKLRELRMKLAGLGLSTLGLRKELEVRFTSAMREQRTKNKSWDARTSTWVDPI